MRELLLLRHGKSDWSTGEEDFNRPLKKRGKMNAVQMAKWMLSQDLIPDLIISSPALRAIKTAEKCARTLGLSEQLIKKDARVYDADLNNLLTVITSCPEEINRLLLVGHNPGLERLLTALIENCPSYPDGKLLPTSALARLELLTDWKSLGTNNARLISITRVKELPPQFTEYSK